MPAQPTDPDQLRGEIAEAREELGETVEALAAKADVKGRAQDKVDEQKDRARAKLAEITKQVKEKPAPAVAVWLLPAGWMGPTLPKYFMQSVMRLYIYTAS